MYSVHYSIRSIVMFRDAWRTMVRKTLNLAWPSELKSESSRLWNSDAIFYCYPCCLMLSGFEHFLSWDLLKSSQ